MEIIHTTQYYSPFIGGAEIYCRNLSEGLSRQNEIKVFSTDVIGINPVKIIKTQEEFSNGVRVIRLPSIPVINGIYGKKDPGRKGFASISFPLRMLQMVDNPATWPIAFFSRAISSAAPQHFGNLKRSFEDSDIAVLFNMITGMTSLSYLAAKLAKRPIVIFPMFHFGLESYERASLYKMLESADQLICSTTNERNQLIASGVPKERTQVVPLGIEIQKIEQKTLDSLREKLEETPSHGNKKEFIVSFVGRSDFDKGYSHLISAVALLARLGYEIRLVLSGFGDTGASYLIDYQYLASSGLLIDLGIADEKTKLASIALSDVFALPSRERVLASLTLRPGLLDAQ